MAGGVGGAPTLVAHTPNETGEWHGLIDHLSAVATRTGAFASRFGAENWGRLAGAWHDLGKADPAFRNYLVAASEGRSLPSPGHSSAGAVLAADVGLEPLAFVIAGHHAGLPSKARLKQRLAQAADDPGVLAALRVVDDHRPLARPADVGATLPGMLGLVERAEGPLCLELLVRMVFSALVDADRLDTEAHMSPERSRLRRHAPPSMAELLGRLRSRHGEVTADRVEDEVAAARVEVRRLVVERASAGPPGLFTLTSPTGSGKTLTVLEAALAHAVRYGLERVVFAVPFISVTEQVADVCRAVVDLDGDAVLEHHSNVAVDDEEGQAADALRRRLLTENWDMPVVVTTTVQLLESLFANRPTACRKLHRLARSVVVIGEAQSIPWELVDPTVQMLRDLTAHFGSSVIMSTATQPRFADLPALRRNETRPAELLGDPDRWATRFARVVARPRPAPMPWNDLVDEIATRAAAEDGQALVVLNTIADAETVAGLLAGSPGARLLTTRLCPAHRREVLAEVHRDLDDGAPVLLVATQLVEAGVDVDFPVGFRAVGPVPSIAQVAGRVNRHGRRPMGELVVFDPQEGHLPPGEYTTGTSICRSFIAAGRDLLAPATVEDYFRRLLDAQAGDLVKRGIEERRRHLDFPEVARRFQLIVDDTVGVLVAYRDFNPADLDVPAAPREARDLLRRLQPYTVSLRRTLYDRAVADALAVEIPGLPVRRWVGDYDRQTGLVLGGAGGTSTVL